MKYQTVKARSSEGLDDTINDLVNNGWKLHGSPYCFTDKVNLGGIGGSPIQREFFCQAVTKEE